MPVPPFPLLHVVHSSFIQRYLLHTPLFHRRTRPVCVAWDKCRGSGRGGGGDLFGNFKGGSHRFLVFSRTKVCQGPAQGTPYLGKGSCIPRSTDGISPSRPTRSSGVTGEGSPLLGGNGCRRLRIGCRRHGDKIVVEARLMTMMIVKQGKKSAGNDEDWARNYQ